MKKRVTNLRRRLLLFLVIMGPGIITANADNDAGGIAAYSVAGAHFGYELLWIIFFCIFSMIVVQEMCARMGAITGKGLSDLIREEFGVRLTFFAMLVLLIANIPTIVAEFAGIAAALEIFGISKFFSVPLIALILWILIVKGTYFTVEKFFLVLCLVFLAYPVTAFLVKPDWNDVFIHTFRPYFRFEKDYLLMCIAIIGGTITPWMQFFVQSSIVDKGIKARQYRYTFFDVGFGALMQALIAYFIIVCCGAILFKEGIRIDTAKEAALALKPLTGEYYCMFLFAAGLFGASMLAASIVPLSTSYAVCEAFGFEAGISKKWKEAPVFFWLYTILIIIGAGVVLIPKLPLIYVMILSQVISGILLPVILVFILILVNTERIMGKYTNSKFYNIISVVTIIFVVLLTGLLVLNTIGQVWI